jgi:hypothetical protein
MKVLSSEQLRQFDSSDWTGLELDPERALVERVRRAATRVFAHTPCRWALSDPGAFQDGALATCLTIRDAGGEVDFLFSSFGHLFTHVRGGSNGSIDAALVAALVEMLETDYHFVFAEPTVLARKYDGAFKAHPMGTWFQRLFCAIYWGNARPHEGVPRWP